MNAIPGNDSRTSKNAFAKVAMGLTAAAALVAGAVYFSGSGTAPAGDNAMEAAQKIVSENQAKPCAAAAAQISVLLLSDKRLKCDGPNVVAP